MAWIDRTRQAVERNRDRNSEEEQRDAREMLARARAEYERRAGDQ